MDYSIKFDAMYTCAQLFQTLCGPWAGACQTPLPMGFSQARPLEWGAISYSRDLPDPGIKPMSLGSPALAGRFFTISITWEAQIWLKLVKEKRKC